MWRGPRMMLAVSLALGLGGCECAQTVPAVVPPPVVRPAPPQPAPVPQSPLRVVRTVGQVERQAEEGWVSARDGEALAGDAVLRSGEGGEAEIEVAKGVHVTLGPQGELQVQNPEGEEGRVTLRQGQAIGEVTQGSGGSLAVGVRGSDAVARTRGGTLNVQRSESGVVAAAALKGEAKLAAGGEEVTIPEGQQSQVRKNKPTAPVAVPASLLLKVSFPKPQGTVHRPSIRVAGRTGDGAARVMVNGMPVVVGEGGEFSAEVALTVGSNQIKVQAHDVGGNHREWASAEFKADPSRPKISPGQEDPWR